MDHLGGDLPQFHSTLAPTGISATYLNDSHQQLVFWVGEGSNVIICLARDSTSRNKSMSPSNLFISYNYGENFTNKTESFKLDDTAHSGYAQLDDFFKHPKYSEFFVFVDSTNKKLFYTKDSGHNIYRSDLVFHPSELAFDNEFPNRFFILDKVDSNRKLYLTLDGGKTFRLMQSFVKTFFWSSSPGSTKTFYVETWNPDGTSSVFRASDPCYMITAESLFEEDEDSQNKVPLLTLKYHLLSPLIPKLLILIILFVLNEMCKNLEKEYL